MNMITMKKLIKVFLIILAGSIPFLSSCVKDGGSPCPNYLSIIYDYNMEFVDQFHREVRFLSIFMFDAKTGVLVREVKQSQQPFPENYTMPVPEEWFGQRYNIVVWAGLDADSYQFPTLTPGTSTFNDFQLKVKDYENRLIDRTTELEPLWYGMLPDVTFSDTEEKTYTVSLLKDTNTFRVVIQFYENNTIVPTNDLDIRLLSADGWYNNSNVVQDPVDREITYLPYYIHNDLATGFTAEMNSLRLISDASRTNKLIINELNAGDLILEFPLIEYLNALRLLKYSNIPLQEYLDREDEFYILIILKRTPGGGDDDWFASQVTINDWVVRNSEVN